jgi:uncharacterized protein (TIGR02453 family)
MRQMPASPHFSRDLIKFLKDLRANNNREWFQANKHRYEKDVRDPLLRFVADFGPRLEKISSHFVADARPMGGSLFRIYRDTRFSRDKSPYKTAAALHFRHEKAKDVHAPGFYLHLEPGNVFAGVGIWHPDGTALAKIRGTIVEKPAKWKRAKSAKSFTAVYELSGESLKRAPKGYDPDHPLIEDLKRKDFVAFTQFKEADLFRADFLGEYAKTARAAKPFMEFLTQAVGLRW